VRRRKDLPAQPRDLRAGTSERLEAIVEAAERAAERVIDEAEEKAGRYIEEARAQADREAEERLAGLAGLSDGLLEQAEALRRRAEDLEGALRDLKERLGAGAPEATAAAAGRQRPVRLAAVAAPEDDVPPVAAAPEPSPPPGRGSAAGARLLATQMAVSGSSRGEIEARLRDGFEIEDTSGILDAILGPEE
jgi:vacuolar-type H+-ATPase subunit H